MSDAPKRDYKDAKGNSIKLFKLIMTEPAWAESQILHRDKLESELAEARAEIERLRNELEDESIRADGMTTAHAEAGADSYRMRELIEQMREAIKFSLIADEVRQNRNVCASDINDACETSRIKRIAALSAAERGE